MILHPGVNKPDREHTSYRDLPVPTHYYCGWCGEAPWIARLRVAGQVPGSNFGLAPCNIDEVQFQFGFTQTFNETYLIIPPPPKKN
jgi:hypothetical protein